MSKSVRRPQISDRVGRVRRLLCLHNVQGLTHRLHGVSVIVRSSPMVAGTGHHLIAHSLGSAEAAWRTCTVWVGFLFGVTCLLVLAGLVSRMQEALGAASNSSTSLYGWLAISRRSDSGDLRSPGLMARSRSAQRRQADSSRWFHSPT